MFNQLIFLLFILNPAFGQDVICGEGTELIDNQCVPIKAVKAESQPPGSCLIATASYGSELAPQVQMLREVRDNTLLNTESGKIFMQGFNTVYYSFSPQIAELENENPVFREAVKLFITPMITTLSIMTLAQDSEFDVIFFGVSTIGLIVGMYIVAPIATIYIPTIKPIVGMYIVAPIAIIYKIKK